MQNSKKSLAFQAKSWFKELKFYEQEIRNCERSLEEILQKVDNQDDLVRAEQFQNQFILQRLNLQRLWKQLREALSLPSGRKEQVFAEALSYRKLFNQLLRAFDQFLHEYFAIPRLNI